MSSGHRSRGAGADVVAVLTEFQKGLVDTPAHTFKTYCIGAAMITKVTIPYIPNMATVSDASNMPQHDLGSYSDINNTSVEVRHEFQ